MNYTSFTADGRDEGASADTTAGLVEAGQEREQSTPSESFARQMGRGLLLVALGVASHLWLDAQRNVVPRAMDETDLAGGIAGERRAVTTDREVEHSFDEPAQPIAPDVVAATPAEQAVTSVADGDTPSFAGSEESSRGTLAVGTSGRAIAPPGRAPRHQFAPTRHIATPSAAVHADPEPREPDAVLASAASLPVNGTADASGPQPNTWRIVNAIDTAPVAGQARHATLRAVDVAPLTASLPSTGSIAANRPPDSELAESSDEDLIRAVLQQYQRAFNELDARAASRVYPTVDQRALARAFSHLEAQSITLEDCGVTLASSGARATCRGVATYVPKVGGGPRQLTREWNFRFARTTDSDWRIQAVY